MTRPSLNPGKTHLDPNRPCPDCGKTPGETDFRWHLSKNRTHEWRETVCKICENKRNRRCAQLRTYKITELDWKLMLKSQNGNCGICGLPFETYETMAVEHSHHTEKFRGIVHIRCNNWLIPVENKIFLAQALAYLARTK